MDWDPDQYNRFRAQRFRPFQDLLTLIPPRPGPRWLDLGCGDGKNTRHAVAELGGVDHVLAVDSSRRMIQAARAIEGPFTWRRADIDDILNETDDSFDFVFSNAAIHWLDDHAILLPRIADRIRLGGWLGIQMPMNHQAPSHTLPRQVASGLWPERFGAAAKPTPQREPSFYDDFLSSRFEHVVCEVRVYRHPMPDTASIASFTRSTTLRPWLAQLSPDEANTFVHAYVSELDRAYPAIDRLGTRLFDFARLLMVGRRAI
jgi:trans-aconitate 2-methyltransferase